MMSSSVGQWINRFILHRGSILKILKPGRESQWPVADIKRILPLHVQRSLQDFDWLYSCSVMELLALVVNRRIDNKFHPTKLHLH